MAAHGSGEHIAVCNARTRARDKLLRTGIASEPRFRAWAMRAPCAESRPCPRLRGACSGNSPAAAEVSEAVGECSLTKRVVPE